MESAEVLAKPLTMLVNKSFRDGIVPMDWNVSNVTLIYKKRSKMDPGNYTPVSLTSVVGKVLGWIVRDQIMSYLSDNDLLSDSFVPRKSIESQLVDCHENWTQVIDKRSNVDLVVRLSEGL